MNAQQLEKQIIRTKLLQEALAAYAYIQTLKTVGNYKAMAKPIKHIITRKAQLNTLHNS